jgi:hypothetical protein
MTTPLEHARDLRDRGFAVIPLPHGTKKIKTKGWQNLRLGEDDLPKHFDGERGNVSVLPGEPSGWLVDVDLDCDRARELADEHLPPTGLEWGRASAPRSHRIYRLTQPAETTKWTSPVKLPAPDKPSAMIVELRSSGTQTVAPGSTHPSGELIRWDADGEPATVDPDELIAAIDELSNAVKAEVDPPAKFEVKRSNNASVARNCTPGVSTPYAREALRREADKVASTPEGARNATLNASAFSLGTLIGGGELDRADAERELHTAVATCRLPEREARATIASGITSGMRQPRTAPEHPHPHAAANGHRWSDPANKPATSEPAVPEPVPAFEPFPTDTLPRSAHALVEHAALAQQSDPAMIAPAVLATMASAIGNARTVELTEGWEEPSIVWTVVLARSGTVKSPALEVATKPATDADADAHDEWREAMERHAMDVLEHEKAKHEWKGNKNTTAGPPEAPAEPKCERRVVSDITIEALAATLAESPRGLLLVSDELAAWLGGFTRYTNGSRAGGEEARWLTLHRAGALTVDRRTRGPLRVQRAALSITGMIQPGMLGRALGGADFESGLVARLFLAMPPERYKTWAGARRGLPSMVTAEYAALVRQLYTLEPTIDERNRDAPVVLRLDGEAEAVWGAYFNEIQRELAGEDERTRAMLAKLEGGAARLALVIHWGRWADGEDVSTERVDADSMRRGITLARWFAREARRVYALLAESDDNREHRELIEWIERQGGTVTVRDLTRGPRAFRGDADKARAALDDLAKAGFGTWDTPPPCETGGRPSARFVLTQGGDGGDGDETPRHDNASGGYVTVASVTTPQSTQTPRPGQEV